MKKKPKKKLSIQWLSANRFKDQNGYVWIKCEHPFAKNGWIMEHRVVVERLIQRFLKPSEVVHHIDLVKDNNHISNLMIFKSQRSHASFHIKMKKGWTNPMVKQVQERWIEYGY